MSGSSLIVEWARSIAEIGQVPETLIKSLQSVCEASYPAGDQFISTSAFPKLNQ